MSDGRKRILIPFTGRKRRKAWNKTKEKHDKIQLKQTRDHIKKWNGQNNFQTVNMHFTMVMKVITMKMINSSSCWKVLPKVASKQFYQLFYKN